MRQRCLALVRDDAHPIVGGSDDRPDLIERHILLQLDRQRLAVTTHRADTYTDSIDRNWIARATENLVPLGHAFPFFAALAVTNVFVYPREQTAGERCAELFDRK